MVRAPGIYGERRAVFERGDGSADGAGGGAGGGNNGSGDNGSDASGVGGNDVGGGDTSSGGFGDGLGPADNSQNNSNNGNVGFGPSGTFGGYDGGWSAAPADMVAQRDKNKILDGLEEKQERTLLDRILGPVTERPAETAINAAVGFVPGVGLVNAILGILGLPTVGSSVTAGARALGVDADESQAPTVTAFDSGGQVGPYGGYGGSRGLSFAGGPYAGRDLQPSQAEPSALPDFLPVGTPVAPGIASVGTQAAARAAFAAPLPETAPAATAGGLPLAPLAIAAGLAAAVAFG